MDDSQVRIGSYETAFEAESLRAVLEEEGIRSWIVDANLGTAGPLQGFAMGHVGVLVERELADRAQEIARRFEEESATAHAEGDAAEGKDHCVACNAEFPEYLEKCPACGLSYS